MTKNIPLLLSIFVFINMIREYYDYCKMNHVKFLKLIVLSIFDYRQEEGHVLL